MKVCPTLNAVSYTHLDVYKRQEGISATFDVMCRYLRWENAGSVLALGCGSREEIKESEYLSQAEVLGRSV